MQLHTASQRPRADLAEHMQRHRTERQAAGAEQRPLVARDSHTDTVDRHAGCEGERADRRADAQQVDDDALERRAAARQANPAGVVFERDDDIAAAELGRFGQREADADQAALRVRRCGRQRYRERAVDRHARPRRSDVGDQALQPRQHSGGVERLFDQLPRGRHITQQDPLQHGIDLRAADRLEQQLVHRRRAHHEARDDVEHRFEQAERNLVELDVLAVGIDQHQVETRADHPARTHQPVAGQAERQRGARTADRRQTGHHGEGGPQHHPAGIDRSGAGLQQQRAQTGRIEHEFGAGVGDRGQRAEPAAQRQHKRRGRQHQFEAADRHRHRAATRAGGRTGRQQRADRIRQFVERGLRQRRQAREQGGRRMVTPSLQGTRAEMPGAAQCQRVAEAGGEPADLALQRRLAAQIGQRIEHQRQRLRDHRRREAAEAGRVREQCHVGPAGRAQENLHRLGDRCTDDQMHRLPTDRCAGQTGEQLDPGARRRTRRQGQGELTAGHQARGDRRRREQRGVEREREARAAGGIDIGAQRHTGKQIPATRRTTHTEQRLGRVEQRDQTRRCESRTRTAERRGVPQPRRGIGEQRGRQRHVAQALRIGHTEQAERGQQRIEHRPRGGAGLARRFEREACDLGRHQPRQGLADGTRLRLWEQLDLIGRARTRAVPAQRRAQVLVQHELQAAGLRRIRGAKRQVAAAHTASVEHQAGAPGHPVVVGALGVGLDLDAPGWRQREPRGQRPGGNHQHIGRGRRQGRRLRPQRAQAIQQRGATARVGDRCAQMRQRVVEQMFDRGGDTAAGRVHQFERAHQLAQGQRGRCRRGLQGLRGAGDQHPRFGQQGGGGVEAGGAQLGRERTRTGGLDAPALARDAEDLRVEQRQRRAGRGCVDSTGQRHVDVHQHAAHLRRWQLADDTARVGATNQPAIGAAEFEVQTHAPRGGHAHRVAIQSHARQLDLGVAADLGVAVGGQRLGDRQTQCQTQTVRQGRQRLAAPCFALGQAGRDDGGDAAAHRVFTDLAEHHVHRQAGTWRAERNTRRAQLTRRVVQHHHIRQRTHQAAAQAQVGVVADVVTVGWQQAQQQAQGVGRGRGVEHRQRDRRGRRAERDERGDRGLRFSGAARGVAGRCIGDQHQTTGQTTERSQHSRQPLRLAVETVFIATRQPARGAPAERDEPVAGGRRRHQRGRVERGRCQAVGGEVDEAARRRIGPRQCLGRRDRHVDDRGGRAAEQLVDLCALGQVQRREVGPAVQLDADGRGGGCDEAPVAAGPARDQRFEAALDVEPAGNQRRHITALRGLHFECLHQHVARQTVHAGAP